MLNYSFKDRYTRHLSTAVCEWQAASVCVSAASKQ